MFFVIIAFHKGSFSIGSISIGIMSASIKIEHLQLVLRHPVRVGTGNRLVPPRASKDFLGLHRKSYVFL